MTENRMQDLQDIIDSLPAGSDDRRKDCLTKGDVTTIYKIASIALEPRECPFSGSDVAVLHGVSRNITRTQKVAFLAIVSTLVTGAMTGIGYMFVHMIKEFLNGNIPK